MDLKSSQLATNDIAEYLYRGLIIIHSEFVCQCLQDKTQVFQNFTDKSHFLPF